MKLMCWLYLSHRWLGIGTRLCVRRRNRGNDLSPYQGVMKLHHIAGLACAFFLTTFIFSGLMSMTPWDLFDANTSFTQQLWRYQQPGDIRNLEAAYSTEEEIRQLLRQQQTDDIKELNWHWLAGQSVLALNHSPDVFQSVYGKNQLTEASLTPQIESAISHLLPDSEVA